MARDVLSNVRQALPRLSSSEARVAEAIVASRSPRFAPNATTARVMPGLARS